MNIRGLHNFISEVLSPPTQELQDERINVELLKIKRAFINPKLKAYNRKKYVAKLCFIALQGHQVSFGLPQILDLVSSKKTSEKRIGWMAAVIICGNDPEQVKQLIPEMKNNLADIKSDIHVCFTLSAISSIGGIDIVENLDSIVYNIALTEGISEFIKKKALLTLSSFIKLPRVIDIKTEDLITFLKDPNSGVRLSATILIIDIIQTNQVSVEDIFPVILEQLTPYLIKNDTEKEPLAIDQNYSKLICNYLRILSYKEVWSPEDVDTLEKMINTLINNTSENYEEENQLFVQYSYIFEICELATLVSISDILIQSIIKVLLLLLNNEEINFLFYFALENLSKIIQTSPSQAVFIHPSIPKLVQIMRSRVEKIDEKSVQLLNVIADHETGMMILKELMDYLPESPVYLRSIICSKASILLQSYSDNEKSCIDSLISIMNDYGSFCDPQIWKHVALSVVKSVTIQQHATQTVFKLVTSARQPNEPLIRLLIYLVGEYTGIIEDTDVIKFLKEHFYKSQPITQSLILSALVKMSLHSKKSRADIQMFFKDNIGSMNLDVSQRSKEFASLLSLPEPILHRIIARYTCHSFGYSINDILLPHSNIESESDDENTSSFFRFNDNGKLYENQDFNLSINVQYDQPHGIAILTFNAINDINIDSFDVVSPITLRYRIVNDVLPTFIQASQSNQIQLEFVATDMFDTKPTMLLKINGQKIEISIPILFARWMNEYNMDQESFYLRWSTINKPELVGLVQLVVPDGNVFAEIAEICMDTFGLKPFNFNIPENNIVMAGRFECFKNTIGVLFRFDYLEDELDLKLHIKATTPKAVQVITKLARHAFL